MQPVIAIVGGTGAEGFGLALRFAKAGARVLVGSRNAARAQFAAARVAEAAGALDVDGLLNEDAVREADIVVLTVPLGGQIATLKSLRGCFRPGTVLVDATVPLETAIGGRASRPLVLWDGSAAEQAARHVPEGVHVAAAFHSLSAHLLTALDRPLDCDVLFCGDSPEARDAARTLVELLPGARAVDAGPLESARLLEALAALMISLNIRHRVRASGVRITGLEPEAR